MSGKVVTLVQIDVIKAWLEEAAIPNSMTPAALRTMCRMAKQAIEELQRNPKAIVIKTDYISVKEDKFQ